MRKYIMITALCLAVPAFAQNKSVFPGSTPVFAQNKQAFPRTTPTFLQSKGTDAVSKKPNFSAFNTQLREKMAQVTKDYRAGKLTKQEARDKKIKLMEVRRKALGFSRQNSGKDISADQKNELIKSLQ